MKEKGKAKMLIDDDFDFENDASSNESLNDISNDESEMAKQLVYINDHKFNLIMKQQKRIAALEAENACLQICLNKETTKDQQIINNNAKRIRNSSSGSNDTSEDDLKLISKRKVIIHLLTMSVRYLFLLLIFYINILLLNKAIK